MFHLEKVQRVIEEETQNDVVAADLDWVSAL
jgi:hypothetical protein